MHFSNEESSEDAVTIITLDDSEHKIRSNYVGMAHGHVRQPYDALVLVEAN